MQFLANENFPLKSVYDLRIAGHNVASVLEDTPGTKDREVLARATAEERTVLTFDRDYGELIYKLRLPAPAGVIYFRFDPIAPQEPAERLLELLKTSRFSLVGMFTVLERGRARQRTLE